MEATIIFLGRTLPHGSSDQPERTSGQGCGFESRCVPLRSCSGWGLPGAKSPVLLVVSYTTVPPLPVPQNAAIGGPFLWHYPSARADWTLSSILPCGARTFLSRQTPPAIVCQTFRSISLVYRESAQDTTGIAGYANNRHGSGASGRPGRLPVISA